MKSKRKVELFVSYARSNKNLARNFLDRFKEYVAPSRRYEYIFWQDSKTLVGEEWHEAICEALGRCTVGLLLISPAFLGSKYISKHELPKFVGNSAKPLIPIMLQPKDFERYDLKGLKRRQIFRLEDERVKSPKSYGECTGNQRDRFVQVLFREVERKLDKLFGGKGA
ncbi:MAG: TIR domain-containing protein [Proteobacteria bacterium]|nr:TIR domain-containing protein [Pseudomonadota bacterium]